MDDPITAAGAPADNAAGTAPFVARFSVVLPDGWAAKSSIEFAAPGGQANVLVSNEPVEPTIDAKRYAELHGALLKEQLTGYRELALEPCQLFGGRAGYLRHFTWKPKNGLPITQLQAYCAEHGRGITATATAKSASFSKFEQAFKRLLAEIEIAD